MPKVLNWSMKRMKQTIMGILANKFDCFIVIEGNRGLGKTQVKGSKVLMADGSWKKVEDVKIGEEVVSPQKDGNFTFEKVTETHNRYEKEIYDIFEKNRQKRKLYSVAGNHNLVISTRKWKELPKTKEGKRRRKKVRTIKEIEAGELAKYKLLKSGNSTICNFSTPQIDFKNQKDPKIDAYTLGAYLGDGSFRSNLEITSPDKEIIQKIAQKYEILQKYEKKGSKGCFSYRFSYSGKLAKQLDWLGLKGKKSGEKFIPKKCKNSSIRYRKELLAGLIDTDGYLMKRNNNHISITTKSEKLAEDIKNIVFSLGGHGDIRKINKKCQGGFQGHYFVVKISFENPKEIPLVCKKKRERLGKLMSNNPRMVAIDIKKGKPNQVYGFSITGESKWYVTDNWMVTHNSTLAVKLAKGVSSQFRGTKKYRFNWNKSLIYTQKETKKFLHRWESTGIADEMINVTFNRDFFDTGQKEIIKMINMNRDHRNLFIACVPSFQTLDSQIKNLCKIRLTVVRRGVAIVQTPNRTIYVKDKWDQATNEKIEREWLQKGSKNPKYTKLTTFRGILRFPALTEKEETKYQQVKDKKRNLIAKEEMGVDEEEQQSDPLEEMIQMLQEGKVKNITFVDGFAQARGYKPASFQDQIRKRLKNRGMDSKLKSYFWEKKAQDEKQERSGIKV